MKQHKQTASRESVGEPGPEVRTSRGGAQVGWGAWALDETGQGQQRYTTQKGDHGELSSCQGLTLARPPGVPTVVPRPSQP